MTITDILDAAKKYPRPWRIEDCNDFEAYIRTGAVGFRHCVLSAAATVLHGEKVFSSGCPSEAAKYLQLDDDTGHTIANSSDYRYLTDFVTMPLPFNPFLRDRLCLELVGGWE